MKKLSTDLGNNYNIKMVIKYCGIQLKFLKYKKIILQYWNTWQATMKKLLKILMYTKKKRKSIDFNIPELRTLTTSGTISDAKKKDLLSLCYCNAIP